MDRLEILKSSRDAALLHHEPFEEIERTYYQAVGEILDSPTDINLFECGTPICDKPIRVI